jgi:hypothetical protein
LVGLPPDCFLLDVRPFWSSMVTKTRSRFFANVRDSNRLPIVSMQRIAACHFRMNQSVAIGSINSRKKNAGRFVRMPMNVMAPYHLVGKNVSVANAVFGMLANCLVRQATAKLARRARNSPRARMMAINVFRVGRFIELYGNAPAPNALSNAQAFAKGRRI